jgi:hypothetical protein
VLSSLTFPDSITYRQRIFHDCLAQPEVVREIYALAVEAVSGEKRIWRARFSRYPAMILHREVEVLGMFVGILKRLRRISDKHAGGFRSRRGSSPLSRCSPASWTMPTSKSSKSTFCG